MSVIVSCDHCRKVIAEVAYVLLGVDAQRPDINRPVSGPTHLHWECVPLYGHVDPGSLPEGFIPEHWPPQHGDIWQDQSLERWSCQQDGSLACLAHPADDAPDEINRVHGPLTLVYRAAIREEEVPF